MTSTTWFALMGALSGSVSVFLSVAWHFGGHLPPDWSGIPIFVLFALNPVCVWLCPRIIKGLRLRWWHFVGATIGFIVGFVLACLFLSSHLPMLV